MKQEQMDKLQEMVYAIGTHGLMNVLTERYNHREKGFDLDHDDQHLEQELKGYAVYLLTGDLKFFPEGWHEKWKQRADEGNDYVNIVKACSVILAEIERLDRAKEYFTGPTTRNE